MRQIVDWSGLLVMFACCMLLGGCGSDSGVDSDPDAGTLDMPGTQDVIAVDSLDGISDLAEAGVDIEETGADNIKDAGEPEPQPVVGVDPPPEPSDSLGFEPPDREADGTPPTPEEVTEFTKRVMAFFADTGYFDWVFRTSHGLDVSYDPDMMDYRLWWQDTRMRRNGDTITFTHHKYAENIAKRTVKVLNGAAAGHLLTGDERMAEVAAHLMRGMVALSLGLEFESEDPLVKYLQSRAVFNHNHSYEVDGRKVDVDYEQTHEASGKWNVHAFEVPDNPTYGTIWVTNMRSKDDVPYMYHALNVATRVYYRTENTELKESARLFIEYMRGFAQSIVDSDWYILTKYADGKATISVDTDAPSNPPADLGSFVHWQEILGPDAECTAQLGAALTGYGYPAGKGDCDRGLIGRDFEQIAGAGNWFNYNIYNYFHIAALSTANLWGYTNIAESLMDGLVERFDTLLWDPELPNANHRHFASDSAGWLLSAATQGYPLTAKEARHIMQWYGDSADWYSQWEHWDPWSSLAEGQELYDYKAPQDKIVPDGDGGEKVISHIRLVEMPYVFEYCWSSLKAKNGVDFIDCDIVADPTSW